MFLFKWLALKVLTLKHYSEEQGFFWIMAGRAVIFLVGLALAVALVDWMLNFISAKGLPPFEFALIFLSFTLLLLLPLVMYSALINSLSLLFAKDEVQFYLALPVSRLSVFWLKFLETCWVSLWTILLVLLVFLAVIQNYFHFSALFFLTGAVGLALFLLIPAVLAVLAVLLISRVFPIVRARGILVVVGLLTGSSVLASIRFMRPENLATAEGKMRLLTFIQNLHRPWLTWLPSEWATNIIYAQSRHDAAGVLVNLSLLAGTAALLVFILYLTARAYYIRVWREAAVSSPLVSPKFFWENVPKLFPVPTRPFIRKDLISLSRDTVEKGSRLILLPLGAVYYYSIYVLAGQLRSGYASIFSLFFIYLFNFFYCSVVIAGLSGRWVLPSISLEGVNFQLLKSSPAALTDFFKAKFIFAFVPLLLIGETLALGAGLILGYAPANLLISVLVTAFICWGSTLVALIVGTREADFTIKEPIDFLLGYNGFACLIYEVIFICLVMLLVGLPAGLFLAQGLSPVFFAALAVALLGAGALYWALNALFAASRERLGQREII
jgi:ABC-2 type transport system permease protein